MTAGGAEDSVKYFSETGTDLFNANDSATAILGQQGFRQCYPSLEIYCPEMARDKTAAPRMTVSEMLPVASFLRFE